MSVANPAVKCSISYEEPRGYYCTICYHGYKRDGQFIPRNLICGHTFCTECLKRLAGQATSFGHVKCPTCKSDTAINARGSFPSNDVRKLPKNFGLLEILEGLQESSLLGRNEITGAAAGSDCFVDDPRLVCEEHEKETKKVYCMTDKEIICIYCQVYGKHRGHDCQLICKVAEEGRQILGNYIEMLSKQRDHMNEARKALTDVTFAVRCREEKLIREVTRHFETLRKKLYRRENHLKSQIKNKTNGKIDTLENQQRTMSDIIVKCEQLRALCQHSQSGHDFDVVVGKEDMENKISKVLEEVSRCNIDAEAQDDLFCQLDSSTLDSMLQNEVVGEDKGRAELIQAGSSDSTDMTSGSSSSTAETSSTEESENPDGAVGHRPLKNTCTAHRRKPPRITVDQDNLTLQRDEQVRSKEVQPDVCIVFENRVPVSLLDAPTQEMGAVGVSSEPNPPDSREVPLPDNKPTIDMELDFTTLPSRHQLRSTGKSTRPHDCVVEGTTNVVSRAIKDFLRFDSPMVLVTSSDESSDLSCLSDLEIDMPPRCGQPLRSSRRRNTSDMDLTDLDGDDEVDGLDMSSEFSVFGPGIVKRSSTGPISVVSMPSLPDPWEVNPEALSPGSSNGSPSKCGIGEGIKCSVVNCSNSAKTWLRCRNCSRAFCLGCAKNTISARRCYKRPRGHSFVRICESTKGETAESGSGCGAEAMSSTHAYSLRSRIHRCENSAEKTWKCSQCGFYNMITANKKSDNCSKCRSQRTL
ncbi:uncharacterized protein LOC144439343 [Glandiceps talaboti]